jgi:hypothetical protein
LGTIKGGEFLDWLSGFNSLQIFNGNFSSTEDRFEATGLILEVIIPTGIVSSCVI